MKKITIILLLGLLSCDKSTYTKPIRKNIISAVYASGIVEYSDAFNLTSITEGYLKDSWVKEGDSVTAGKDLFQLDNDIQYSQVIDAQNNYKYAVSNEEPQIKQLEEQISQAKEKYEISERNFKRYKELLKSDAVAIIEYEQMYLTYQTDLSNLKILEKSLAELKNTINQKKDNNLTLISIQKKNNDFLSLKSESEGLILNIYKKKGDLVKKGEVIAEIGTGELILALDIAESDISKIFLNQRVIVSLSTEKDKTYSALISKIYPAFDVNKQAFKVEAKLIEKPKILLSGTQLQANIITDKKNNALVIPSSYLWDGDSIKIKKNKKKIKVSTGIKTDEWIEITAGLDENSEIENKR